VVKYAIFFLFTLFLNAQTVLLNETFSNFFSPSDTANSFGYWVLNPEWRALYGGENDSLTEDLSPFGNDLTVGNWASYAAMLDSCKSGSMALSGGTSLKFTGGTTKHYLYTTTGTGVARANGSWTMLFIWNPAVTGTARKQILMFGAETAAQGAWVYHNSSNTMDFDLSATAGPNGVTNFTQNNWYQGSVGNSSGTIQMYLSGATESTSASMSPNITSGQIGIGHANSSIGQTWGMTGRIEVCKLLKGTPSVKTMKEFGFLAAGWASLKGGVSRVSFGYYQGLTGADTIYYGTPLTAGSWSISIDDSAASEVGYSILTSSDKSTWSTLGSGTTGTSWGTKTYSGTGLGYIGIAIASGTAYFDNLTVTLQPATTTGKFKGYLTNDWFKSW